MVPNMGLVVCFSHREVVARCSDKVRSHSRYPVRYVVMTVKHFFFFFLTLEWDELHSKGQWPCLNLPRTWPGAWCTWVPCVLVQNEESHLGICETLTASLMQSWVARGAPVSCTPERCRDEEGPPLPPEHLCHLFYQGFLLPHQEPGCWVQLRGTVHSSMIRQKKGWAWEVAFFLVLLAAGVGVGGVGKPTECLWSKVSPGRGSVTSTHSLQFQPSPRAETVLIMCLQWADLPSLLLS